MIRRFTIRRGPFTKTNTDASLTSLSHLPPVRTLSPAKKTSLMPPAESRAAAPGFRMLTVPEPRFFARLKAEEHYQFTHRNRIRSNYTENISAALALPYSRKELEAKKDNQNALLSMAKKNVLEHANRRVDLYFYTLIAYYKKEVFPTTGHTDLQHGRGRHTHGNRNLTEACHSCLMPSLLDTTIYQNKRGRTKHKSLLSGTHFMDSLNTTVELPPFVNDIDDVLEEMCREKSLEILCDVSCGKINPIRGLAHFLKMMRDVLNDLKREAAQKSHTELVHHSLIGKRKFQPALIELIINGTLCDTFSDKTETVTDEYIQLLLRVTPEEKVLCKENEQGKQQIYLGKMMGIQKEILQTKSSHNLSF